MQIPLIQVKKDLYKKDDVTITGSKEFLEFYNSLKKEFSSLATPFLIVRDKRYEYVTGLKSCTFACFYHNEPENIAKVIENFILGHESLDEEIKIPSTAIINNSYNNQSIQQAYKILKPKYGLNEIDFTF